jgi:hypothetical protein
VKKDFCGFFLVSQIPALIPGGGDGEADRPAGPRRVRDSRRGGRQRCWGGTLGDGPSAGGAGGIRTELLSYIPSKYFYLTYPQNIFHM